MISKPTPILMRLAYSYLKKGEGWYTISNPLYDQVHVHEVANWQPLLNPVRGIDYGAVMRVSFKKGDEVVRFVDFAVLQSGSGGEPEIRLVEVPPSDSSQSDL